MKKALKEFKRLRKYLKENRGFLYGDNKYWIIPCPHCVDGVFIRLIPSENILMSKDLWKFAHHFDCKMCNKKTHVVLGIKAWSFLEDENIKWFENEYE